MDIQTTNHNIGDWQRRKKYIEKTNKSICNCVIEITNLNATLESKKIKNRYDRKNNRKKLSMANNTEEQ